jgi:hypothetical protein
LQQTDDPTRFILVEIYKTADALALQRNGSLQAWRDAVIPMMAEPGKKLPQQTSFQRIQLVMVDDLSSVWQSREMLPRENPMSARRHSLWTTLKRHKDMFSFEFATASRIIFGAGKLNELDKLIKGNAKHVLLVRGGSSDAIPRVREILSSSNIPFTEFSVHGEPTVDVVRKGMKTAHDCDMIIVWAVAVS